MQTFAPQDRYKVQGYLCLCVKEFVHRNGLH